LSVSEAPLEAVDGGRMKLTGACRTKTAMRLFEVAVTCFALNLTGCAHGVLVADRSGGQGSNQISGQAAGGANGRSMSKNEELDIIKEAPGPTNDLSDTGADLNAIPLEVNRMVLQWIDYFQGRGRPHMERYLSRLPRYAPAMKEILRKEGLPEDLIYIALIESGFSATAHSSASAVGYWQFIKGTGKRYNLMIDNFVDERRDFIRSTQAAADYFKGLYNLFGAWYLAIASYNVGENRVKNVVMKYHTRDFWKLARENKLPDETVNYVPKFLAARLIAREPEKYGFTDIEPMPPLAFSEVEFETAIDIRKLAQGMGLDYDDLRDLNPSYKRGVAFTKNGRLVLRVPKGAETQAVAAAAAAVALDRKRYVAEEDYTYYRVRRGDTLASIASKFGTTQHEIRSLNHLRSRLVLAAGRRIRVPAENLAGLARQQIREEKAMKSASADSNEKKKTGREKVSHMLRETSRSPSSLRTHGLVKARSKGRHQIHVVRKGETLAEIARKHQVSLKKLTKENRLSRNSKVQTGARIVIPD
jgi:membrane-bound lytic murein transglycosylase D